MIQTSPETKVAANHQEKVVPPLQLDAVIDPFSGNGSTISGRPDPARAIEGIRIHTDSFVSIHRALDHARSVRQIAAEPYCMLVVGESGVGKSSVIDEYLRQNRPRRQPQGMIIPVLSVVTPSQATMGSMASAFLSALGDPLPDKGNIDARTRRTYKLLEECQTEIIIIDELQHFIDRDRETVLSTVTDWLKNLITATKIPIILVGLPQSRRVLAANEQLKRRFQSQVELRRFNWGADRKRFLKFLEMVEKGLPIKTKDGLNNPVLAEKLYRASEGLPATLMKIVRRASHNALNGKTGVVELSDFDVAYKQTVFQDSKGPGTTFFSTVITNPPFLPSLAPSAATSGQKSADAKADQSSGVGNTV